MNLSMTRVFAILLLLVMTSPAFAQTPPPAQPSAGAPDGRQGPPPGGRQGFPGGGGGGRGPQVPFVPGPGRSNDPYAAPIAATEGVIKVNFTEFATIPDSADGHAPRMNLLVDEPATKRLFVNGMTGQLYSVSYDGKTVTPYLDINTFVPVQSGGSERGFQSFAFHPQFARRGTPGFGKFYTYTDTSDMTPKPDFTPLGAGHTHDIVLLEWTAKDPAAAAYDGVAPKELFRAVKPFANHNGGQISFNPLVTSGPEFGLLYVGLADGGSGGDPYNHAQNLNSAFGKILRINPLGTNSANGKYGIPPSNPFAGKPEMLGEIYAYGVRNPQRIGWDSKNGNMFVADIGQNIVEEVSPVTAGANLGWNVWEASFKYFNREVGIEDPRTDPKITYPVAEFDHRDPLLVGGRAAITGVYVYRATAIPQLAHLLIFGDNPSGEIFYVDADKLPKQPESIHRILFNDSGQNKTLLDLIKEKNTKQGKPAAGRADLRMGMGPNGRLFVLNKHDGTIREVLK